MNLEKYRKIYTWEPVGLTFIHKKHILQGLLLGPTATDILTFPFVDVCVEHFAAKIQ